MTYDFTTLLDRSGQGSFKWEQMKRQYPGDSRGLMPFSVADMELLPPPELVDGLKRFAETTIFGYTQATDAYYQSVQDWMRTRHGFCPPREWFVEFPGVVPALHELVRALTRSEDAVLILSPVYYPFRSAVEKSGRTLVQSVLIDRGTTYDIDFDDAADKLSRPEVTMMILCSPHNPVGRVWTREELLQLCTLCRDNGVFLVSDEIHFDLILPGHTHTSIAALPEFLDNTAICTAPSKTFNLAGLQTSNIFIPNAEKRRLVQEHRGPLSLNCFGYRACELAYSRCGDWLEQLLALIARNRDCVTDFLARHLPQVHVYDLQGTYLLWMDFRAFGLAPRELEHKMQQAGWFCDEGYIFGTGGDGFERLNLACPTWVLEQALPRLAAAFGEGAAQ